MADTTSAAPSERELFEAHAKERGFTLGRCPYGGYQCRDASIAWLAWQAARRAPQPVAHDYEEIVAAWNAQADEHNQWDELAEDEKIEWAVRCAQPVAREPLTALQIREAIKAFKESERLLGVNHMHIARAIERAHGITGGKA